MKTEHKQVKKKSSISPYVVKNMLVGLDLEENEDKTLTYLEFFTGRIPTRNISFIHVVPQLTYLSSILEIKPDMELGKINAEVIAIMKDRVRNTYNPIDKHQKSDFAVRHGDPLEELLAFGKSITADLLVIGQKSGEERHGITAKKLARKTDCTALVVPDQAKPSLSHILVPVDFSDCSGRALKLALQMREQLNGKAKITAIHVYTMPNLSTYKIDRPYASFQKIIMGNISESMAFFLKRVIPGHEKTVNTDLVYKDLPGVSRYIMDYAEESGADLIVMGAKGHSRVELLLLGSVTERLLHLNKEIATLVVR